MKLLFTMIYTVTGVMLAACNSSSPKPRGQSGDVELQKLNDPSKNTVSPEDLLILKSWQRGQTLGNKHWLMTVGATKKTP